MKNNTKPASKTPIDVLRALTTARRAVEELVAALELIDPSAFGTAGLHANAVDAAGLATATVLEMVSARPLTKTERAARAAAEPVASPSPDSEPTAGEAFDTSFDFGANVVEAEVEAQPEPAPSVEELRRVRKRERDRASAARRREAAAAA